MLETKILVVEDEALVAEDIRRTLKNMGYNVPSTATSGEEAIKKVEEINPDLVLMDIVLQGEMDGVETARQISCRFNTPVIYLTAYSDKITLERAKITEPFGYIIKPFRENELKMAIEIALFKHDSEKRLKESEERFRSMVESAPYAVIITDSNGKIISWNKSAEKIFLYAEEEVLRKPLTILMPDLYRDAHRRGLECVKLTEKSNAIRKTVELHGLRKDGSEFPLELSLSTWTTEKGAFYGGIIRDITESRRAEEALKQSEKKYRTLIENIQDGVFIIQDAKIQFVNEAFARIAGYTVEEVTGKDFHELVAPEDLEMVADRYSRRQAGEKVPKEYEFCILHKDGTRIIVNMNVGLINYRDRVASMGTVKDITERRRAEEALRESEDRHRRIVDLSPFGIFIHSDHKIVYANLAGMKILGATEPEELIGKPVHQFIHPDYYELVKERIRKEEQGEIAPLAEEKLLRLDGTSVDVEIMSIPFSYKGKLAMYGVFQDITKRKHAEEKINNSIREKEVLLREIHHRVKNNMQIISSLLKLQSGYTNEEKYRYLLKECQNRIASMSLIHEKLHQSKDFAIIDLNEYIRDLTTNLFQSYCIKRSAIALNIDVEKVNLGIDLATTCGLIINELVTNSLKYAFPGGRKGEIKIALKKTGENTFELTVYDDGVGIPEDLDFRKVKSLGLSLVTMLVEDQLEGEISLDRSRGTEFQIKFKD